MAAVVTERAVARLLRAMQSTFGQEVQRLRDDAGITRAELARASGVDPSFLARIEIGVARPSLETCARLAIALGCDLGARLFPNTGPLIRDRHQAAIAESLLGVAHRSWARFAEIAVRRPSRGWIDLGFHHGGQGVFAAIEIQSELRRLEQLLRWSEEKAASLPSWDGWSRLVPSPAITRLLVVRDTRATREVASTFRRVMRVAYPGDPVDALASLTDGLPWPGPSLLWAVKDRGTGRYRIIARP